MSGTEYEGESVGDELGVLQMRPTDGQYAQAEETFRHRDGKGELGPGPCEASKVATVVLRFLGSLGQRDVLLQ